MLFQFTDIRSIRVHPSFEDEWTRVSLAKLSTKQTNRQQTKTKLKVF